jgi:hypothetical protein
MSISEAFKALVELRKELADVKREYYTFIKPLLEDVLKELRRLNENIERLREWKG